MNKNRNQSGNAVIYILIAVGLLAALMFSISRSSVTKNSQSELSEGQSKILANEIITYASSANTSIVNMMQSGQTIDQIDFMLPSDSNFNSAPTIFKLFHPDGGGLSYKPMPSKASADDGTGLNTGIYIGRFNNFEWTPSTTNDVVFTAYEIKQNVCEAINFQLTKSTTIPTMSGGSLANLLVDDALHTGSNQNVTTVNCAACNEIPSLCVTDGSGKYAFYSLLVAD